MKPAPCSWRGVTCRMPLAAEAAVDLERVHAGDAEHDVDAALLEQARERGAAARRRRRHRRPSRTGVSGRPSRRQAVTLAACLRSASSSPSRAPEGGVRRHEHARVAQHGCVRPPAAPAAARRGPRRPAGRRRAPRAARRASTSAPRAQLTTKHPAAAAAMRGARRAAAARPGDSGRVQRDDVGTRQQLVEQAAAPRRRASAPPAPDRCRAPCRTPAPPSRASARPVRPSPTMPSVSDDGRRRGPVAKQSQPPSRTWRSKNGRWRTRPSAMASDVVATSSVVASGHVGDPDARAPRRPSRSMWSMPTVTVATIAQRRAAPRRRCAVDGAVADQQRRRAPPRPRPPRPASRATASRTSKPASRSSCGPVVRGRRRPCRRRPRASASRRCQWPTTCCEIYQPPVEMQARRRAAASRHCRRGPVLLRIATPCCRIANSRGP